MMNMWNIGTPGHSVQTQGDINKENNVAVSMLIQTL